MRISVKAVIFDYGNVLSTAQPAGDTQAMATILDMPLVRFTEAYWQFRIEYDAGLLEANAYWNAVAKTTSRTLTGDQISALTEIDSRSWSHPAPVMPEWARDLRVAGFRIAILSNIPATVRDYVVQCPWLPEFDARTFSCDLGICKPDPKIYRNCLDNLRIKPSEALFIDDREPNVRAAEILGMNGIHFTGAARAAIEIGDRFSLPIIPSTH